LPDRAVWSGPKERKTVMATNYAKHLQAVPQTVKAKASQVKNNAGGFTFALDVWKQMDRFLILGCDGGSYYASEREMTIDNALSVEACLNEDGLRAVARIVEISDAGRAPKNDPAIFALALASAHANPATRKAALEALPRVCRTGTHLFHFAQAAENFRRWGRGLRRAVAGWYNDMPADRLAVQVTKYRQRDGWSHRDLLRLAHPSGVTPEHNAIFRWVAGEGSRALIADTKKGKAPRAEDLPGYIFGFERLQAAEDKREVVKLIRQFSFTHEMLPTVWKNEVEVWDALLEAMPQTALIRNLAKMTAVGLLKPMSKQARRAAAMIADERRLRQARVHPLSVLAALKVYEQGHGEKGALTWKPEREIVDALNEAFYLAFKAVEPTGKKHLLAIDVSGSMTCGNIAGMPGINPRIGSAAMAMVTARVEPTWHAVGFSHELLPLAISPRQTLQQVISTINGMAMGGTDCAAPMLYAIKNRIEVDTFVVYTDNETWFGGVHPFQALKQYRQAMGRPAKLIVAGMTATKFTIADPSDHGMLDVVGFDSAAPAVMAAFSRD
jgi:60 kDa SS-A/Ro ribonucleoprotein